MARPKTTPLITKICEHCQKSFQVKAYRTNKFHTRACWNAYRRGKKRVEYDPDFVPLVGISRIKYVSRR